MGQNDEIMAVRESDAERWKKCWEKFENEIKEKLSLWLADVNEPIWKQIEKLQERVTELEVLIRGHPHDEPVIQEIKAEIEKLKARSSYDGPYHDPSGL